MPSSRSRDRGAIARALTAPIIALLLVPTAACQPTVADPPPAANDTEGAIPSEPPPTPATDLNEPEPDEPETDEPEVIEPEADVPYYANCAAVRAAGVAPLRKDDAGYRTGLDRDRDGLACE